MYDQDVNARRGIAQLALKGFFSLSRRWRLTRPEAMTLLGLTATSTYANWKNGRTGTIPRDTLERISYLLNIDERLRQELETDAQIVQWLRHSTTEQHRTAPLTIMLQGNVIDIHWVQTHLETLLEGALEQS